MNHCLKSSEINASYEERNASNIISDFSMVTESGVITNKEFCKIIKPFLTNKGFLSGNEIKLIENDEVITEEKY